MSSPDDTPLAVITLVLNRDNTLSMDVKGELAPGQLIPVMSAAVLSMMDPANVTFIPGGVEEVPRRYTPLGEFDGISTWTCNGEHCTGLRIYSQEKHDEYHDLMGWS